MALDPGEMAHYEKRFTIEARAAGSLNHPNIVTIYDIGRSGDLAYMAMEFLDGRELKDLMAAGEVSVDRALDIAAQVADGLAYAHARDVVHRDVKPANIMILADGRVKITDFGIARMRTAEVRTQTGVVLGSPRYLSPEQVLGKAVDARADIFSLGVIAYEMVTGQAPFKGADVSALMYQIVHHDPAPPSTLNPQAPPMLDLILAKALAKRPDERYASIAELAADLRACRARSAEAVKTVPSLDAPLAIAPASATVDPFPDTVQLPRVEEIGAPLPADAMPARGLAKEFDSVAATMRLAVQTGAIANPQAFEAHFAVTPGAADAHGDASGRAAWSRRDRAIFLGAVAGATVLGAVIVFV
jgi:serine/threonine-protein kinase